ncbi:MAG: hypothetical protein C4524_04100 [Candidatus Zixiibacteriota bacterium]|nr:MAG: hypothetical protein C4524_04100 [candidate division Zixibacteria bacterium]
MGDLLELKAELVRHRVRQRELAQYLQISESHLSDILNSIKPVDSELYHQIRIAFEALVEKHRHT